MTALSRAEAARRFAEVMPGWTYHEAIPGRYAQGGIYMPPIPPCFSVPRGEDMLGTVLFIPAPDAPLHEMLAFVGRIAEAVGAHVTVSHDPCFIDGSVVEVSMWLPGKWTTSCPIFNAHDISWNALLAGVAAKEGR